MQVCSDGRGQVSLASDETSGGLLAVIAWYMRVVVFGSPGPFDRFFNQFIERCLLFPFPPLEDVIGAFADVSVQSSGDAP